MILLFQINPSASESALAVDHMRSFFECVLRDYYHHDVRTISAMMLERIADARQRGGGLSLPPESLFSLASRIAARSKCPPWQCPRSAPAPPQGAPGEPGRLEAPRARGQATARPATALGARASLLQSCRSAVGRHQDATPALLHTHTARTATFTREAGSHPRTPAYTHTARTPTCIAPGRPIQRLREGLLSAPPPHATHARLHRT